MPEPHPKLLEVVNALPMPPSSDRVAEAEAALKQARNRHKAATRAFRKSRKSVEWSPDRPPLDSAEFGRMSRAHEQMHRAYTETGIAWAQAEDDLREAKKEMI